MKKQIHILLVEDSLSYIQGMQLLLSQHPDIKSVDYAHDAENTFSFLEKNTVDIILLDLGFNTEEFNGFDIAKKIKETYPQVKVLILSQHIRKHYYKRLFDECMVDGYLDKELGIEEIYDAISHVMKGGKYIDSNIKSILEIEEWMKVSEREKDVIILLSKGLAQKEVAHKLCISQKTVETHIGNLLKKFEVKNSVELVRRYIRYRNANRENGIDNVAQFEDM